MTSSILAFPFHRQMVLSCVWFDTGNPTKPLACHWIPRWVGRTRESDSIATVSRLRIPA
jgi:hypothetical protein